MTDEMSDIAKEAMLMSQSGNEKEINEQKNTKEVRPKPQKNVVAEAKSLDPQ